MVGLLGEGQRVCWTASQIIGGAPLKLLGYGLYWLPFHNQTVCFETTTVIILGVTMLISFTVILYL